MSDEKTDPIASIQEAVLAFQTHSEAIELRHVLRIFGAIRVRVLVALVAPLIGALAGAYALGARTATSSASNTEIDSAAVFQTARLLVRASTDMLKAQAANSVNGWNSERDKRQAIEDLLAAKRFATKSSFFDETSVQRVDDLVTSLNSAAPDFRNIRSRVGALIDEFLAQLS